MLDVNEIVTGEKIQAIADVYIGTHYYFNYNPYISSKIYKFKDITEINTHYYNPRVIYCYGDLIDALGKIIHFFINPFILITHNSDKNIVYDEAVNNILRCPKLIRWHAQNVDYLHNKLHFIPIGIANRQWEHGNLSIYQFICENYHIPSMKNKPIFMNFKIETNPGKRMICYETLFDKIPFLQFASAKDNILRMLEYQFCICPEGNGVDTHRLWECFYLQIVPIVLSSTFTRNIQQTTGLPMILLDSWKDFNRSTLPKYETFDFGPGQKYLKYNHYVKEIIS
jgi:hypothetical protein